MHRGDLVALSAYGRRLVADEHYQKNETGILIEMTPLRYRVHWGNGRREWHVRRDIKKMKKV